MSTNTRYTVLFNLVNSTGAESSCNKIHYSMGLNNKRIVNKNRAVCNSYTTNRFCAFIFTFSHFSS